MPFNRRYDESRGEWIVDRTLTGPPPPPSTGTTVAEDGAVVADSATVTVVPSKIIPVTMPGPREPVLDATGIMAPRWRRFFEELYRRTGALEDNVNGLTDKDTAGSGTTATATIASTAPTVVHSHQITPSTASTTIAGQQADRTVA